MEYTTTAVITHQPANSNACCFGASESVPPDAVVPLGSVPLMAIVRVPFTVEIVTRVLFSAA